MSKPLFRWTVGPCLPQGLEILGESLARTTAALGIDTFDWVVCYNGLDANQIETIRQYIGNRPITLYEQSWANCPVPDACQSPQRSDGSFEWNGNRCGGTMWKVCPARMRMESHEIIMDNDIILQKKFPQIDYFLKVSNMALILEEPIRFYGRYDSVFPDGGSYLNSGFMGFPPGYNFGAEVLRVWEEYGRHERLSQADEQGLLVYTLSRFPSLRIKKEQMKELLARDLKNSMAKGDAYSYHFTQSNRIPQHIWWKKYKEIYGLAH